MIVLMYINSIGSVDVLSFDLEKDAIEYLDKHPGHIACFELTGEVKRMSVCYRAVIEETKTQSQGGK